MKTAIVYYSMEGNTSWAAEKIAERIGAQCIRLVPVKAYPDSGFKKFLWGGKSAVMGECPALEPYAFNAADYDRIILGTPVWAGTFAPPLRTFLKEHAGELAEKHLAAFACCSGGKADKAIDNLEQASGVGEIALRLTLTDPKTKQNGENDRKLAAFCDMLQNAEDAQ